MVDILRNQNLSTRFRIMAEIAAHQPGIPQKLIARRLEITPQAVSDYIKQLSRDGLLTCEGRSRYRLSIEGVDWLIRQIRAAGEYLGAVEHVISNLRLSAAVAGDRLKKGQTVGLMMRDGLLVATAEPGSGARGVAQTDAAPGDDVGVSDIQGVIEMATGQVTILEIPGIAQGGSGAINLARLKREVEGQQPVIASGIEAVTAFNKINRTPDITYAASEVAIDMARKGISPRVVGTSEEVASLAQRLTESGLEYQLISLKKAN